MLTIRGEKQRFCDGISRREFLKIGGLSALMIGSGLQAFALLLYLGFNGLTSLYVVSGLFGLFQGGIIPMYAVCGWI